MRGPVLRHPRDREIARLALPALGALVAEPLFLLADSAIVGHLGTPQLAGLGVAGAALSTVVSLCVFLAYGTTAGVARRLGAGDLAGSLRAGVDGCWLALGMGAALAIVGALASGWVVTAIGAGPEVRPYALVYLRLSLLGVPGMLVVLAATGVLRGLQDTRTPLLIEVVGYVANVALNLALVYPGGLGIAGSALGTAATQLGMAAAYLVVLARTAGRLHVGLRPHPAGVLTSARAGVPLLVRTASLRVVLLLATAVAARQGVVALAAHQVAFQVWTLLALAIDAVAIAGQAIIGRYLGAGDQDAVRASTRRMVEWGLATGALLGLLLAVSAPLWVPVFSADPAVRSLLVTVLLVQAVLQPVNGVVFVLDGVLIGAGDGRYLAGAGVLTMLVFLPAAWWVLVSGAGLVALWTALGLFMAARLAVLGSRARGSAWMVTGATG